jgi:hypothetical protein
VPAADLPNIVIHEEPPGSWHIVLPAKLAEAGDLSDADLEKGRRRTDPRSGRWGGPPARDADWRDDAKARLVIGRGRPACPCPPIAATRRGEMLA